MSNPQNPPPTSKLAIAALVLSILCVPLVGALLGVYALVQISRSQGRLGGQVLAIVAIVVGSLGTVMVGIMTAIAIPNFLKFQNKSKQSEAMTNLRSIQTHQMGTWSEKERFLPARAEGGGDGKTKTPWPALPCPDTCAEQPETCTFTCLGWQPMGPTYYQYACNVQGDAFTCAASADLDGDGTFGLLYYAYQHNPEARPAPLPRLPGADACGTLEIDSVTPCVPNEF